MHIMCRYLWTPFPWVFLRHTLKVLKTNARIRLISLKSMAEYGLREGEMSSGVRIAAVPFSSLLLVSCSAPSSWLLMLTSSSPFSLLYTLPITLQTTIMAVTFDGGVIMGADSRTSTGSYVANRVSDKIVPITDHIWACRSGSAADTQAVIDMVKYYVQVHNTELGRKCKVKTCATLMQKICYENKDRLMAGIIVGGWDPYHGGQVFEIPLGGVLMEQKFALGGSGSTYVYGLVDHTFKTGMTKEECKKFVKDAVAHAMCRDGSSGGVIRMCIIDEGGVEKEVTLGDQLPYGPVGLAE